VSKISSQYPAKSLWFSTMWNHRSRVSRIGTPSTETAISMIFSSSIMINEGNHYFCRKPFSPEYCYQLDIPSLTQYVSRGKFRKHVYSPAFCSSKKRDKTPLCSAPALPRSAGDRGRVACQLPPGGDEQPHPLTVQATRFCWMMGGIVVIKARRTVLTDSRVVNTSAISGSRTTTRRSAVPFPANRFGRAWR